MDTSCPCLRLWSPLLALLSLLAFQLSAASLGTAFTYQGRLSENGEPATGVYAMRFTLWDAGTNGTLLADPLVQEKVAASNGCFTVLLDFGVDRLGRSHFRGDPRWLEVGVDRYRATNYTTLSPRQPLTPAPYAFYAPQAYSASTASMADTAASVPATGLTGTVPDGRLSTNVPLLASSPSFGGTVSAGGDLVAERLQIGNACSVDGVNASVAGGDRNTNQARGSFVGSGTFNRVQPDANYSMVGAGSQNTIESQAICSFLGGGLLNSILSGANYATLGGGYHNTNSGDYSTVPGGSGNAAQGTYSFAAGRRAKAAHLGAFVWADATAADFTSTAANQFLLRANGGVGINTNDPDGAALSVAGTVRGTQFQGSGAGLTSLSAASLAAGNVTNAINFLASAGVGIGTSSPLDSILDVEGNIHLNNYDLFLRGGSDRAHGLGFYNSGKLFGNAAPEGPVLYGSLGGGLGTTYPTPSLALAWNNSGNVGIGTLSPSYPLDVQAGQAAGRFLSTNGGGISFLELRNASASASLLGALNFNNSANTTPAQIAYDVTGGITLRSGGAERMRITPDGQVGIGTTDPQAALRVVGDLVVNSASVASLGADRVQLGTSTASANYATAMGRSSAEGTYSTAMGRSTAQGYASIAMGYMSAATNDYSLAAGRRAKANHTGSFVWADSQNEDFASTSRDQVRIRATNGVCLAPGTPLVLEGNHSTQPSEIQMDGGTISCNSFAVPGFPMNNKMLFSLDREMLSLQSGGSGASATFDCAVNAISFNPTSDRNAKENFAPVDSQAVLDHVAALPISQWNFKSDASSLHIGPMAQDFHAAFGTGSDDKHIATVDADGVALAAIQGLNRKLETENAALRKELAELRALVGKLAAKVNRGEP